ncbi:centrosomal protein of 128 kDa isoform X2 [Stigmatopora nigra]
MDTSSGSDSYDKVRGHRPQGRETHRRPPRERGRASGRAGDGRADISNKISTLCSTLQDTNRNLTKVDQMLGQYREHTDDQAEAMALLRDNLEESISQLQAQRLSRSNEARGSASASSMHSSDLDGCPGSDSRRLKPTSPLKDYTSTSGRRRSHSASVHFKNSSLSGQNLHELHQSLRDLRCDQQRLSVDLDREIVRRNRAEIDTKIAIESLSDHMAPVQRRASSLERHAVSVSEREDTIMSKQQNSEKERFKMEHELERVQRLLDQSEDSRESLVQQVDNMRGELLRTRKEKTELQKAWLQPNQPIHCNYQGREEERLRVGSDMEKEVAELRAQLHKVSVNNEVEKLKKSVERKERERLQLSIQLEGLSTELARREEQQVEMLEKLKEIQSRGKTEKTETEALLHESTRSKEELRAKAQKAVHQWRTKCSRLQRDLEEARTNLRLHTEKAAQALSQQAEAARKELAENLQRLALREEELHRKDVSLSQSYQRQLAVEQEIREVRESSVALQMEVRRHLDSLARLREDNQRLVEQADTQALLSMKDQNKHDELQDSLNHMTAAHAQLSQRLTVAEASKNELQKVTVKLQAKLAMVQQEPDTLRQQLQLEREIHQKEVVNLKATIEESRMKNKELHEMLVFCRQQRDEIQSHLNAVQEVAVSDKKLCEALQVKLDRMKDECDKLSADLRLKEDAHAVLYKNYQLLNLELEEIRSDVRGHATVTELIKLEQKVAQMETEHGLLLSTISEELDVTLQGFPRNGDNKYQATKKATLEKDSSFWHAEIKSKIRWLREEMREHDTKEHHLRRQHKYTRDELKALKQSRSTDRDALLQRLEEKEKMLHSISKEKKELLEVNRKKDEEVRSLQGRVLDLKMESQQQKELVDQRYIKHKEIVWDLQHQLDESKRKIHECREEKLDAASRSLRRAVLASSIDTPDAVLNGTGRADTLAPHKRLTTFDLDGSTMTKSLTDPLQLNHI